MKTYLQNSDYRREKTIICQIFQEYKIESAQDIWDALKNLLDSRWRRRWITISVMKNLKALTMMITIMVTNLNRSIAVMTTWKILIPQDRQSIF